MAGARSVPRLNAGVFELWAARGMSRIGEIIRADSVKCGLDDRGWESFLFNLKCNCGLTLLKTQQLRYQCNLVFFEKKILKSARLFDPFDSQIRA
jgi:hypothetical protein